MGKKAAAVIEQDEPGLDISSLIDVCFLLLIYFISAMTIKVAEQDVPLSLPASEGSSSNKSNIDALYIRVDPNGSVSTGTGSNSEILDSDVTQHQLPLLETRLDLYTASASASGKEPLVQVYVAGDTEEQRVVDVLNALAKFKIRSITFTEVPD